MTAGRIKAFSIVFTTQKKIAFIQRLACPKQYFVVHVQKYETSNNGLIVFLAPINSFMPPWSARLSSG